MIVSIRMVALGDSTTFGIGDPLPGGQWRGFAALLAEAFGDDVSFTNVAASGARAADVRHIQLDQALRHRPQVATLVVGVNDTMRSDFDPAAIRDHVVVSAGALSAAGAVLLSVRLHDHSRVFGIPELLARPLRRRIELVNAAYDEAHERFGGIRLELADIPWVYRRESWSVDRLHPSELGHRRLAWYFAQRLAADGWPVRELPSIERCDGVTPTRSADLRWMVLQGVPWVGRRARDLVPWAATMAGDEIARRVTRRVRGRRRQDEQGRIASAA